MDLNTKPLTEDERGFHLRNEVGGCESNNEEANLKSSDQVRVVQNPVEEEEPREGMWFGTLVEARNYYYGYAAKMGFVPKIRNTNFERHTKNKIPISQSFHCNKDGYRGSKKKPPKRVRTIAFVGCKARCYVALDRATGLWKISRLELSHTHPLNPKPLGILENRSVIQSNNEAGIRPNQTFRALTGSAEKNGSFLATPLEEPSSSSSPIHSPAEKNRKICKDNESCCGSGVVPDHDFGSVLNKNFDAGGFIDKYLLTSSTMEALEKVPTDENISSMQQMLLQSAVLCRDMERKFSDLPKLKMKLAAKDKEIYFLSVKNIELYNKTIELSSQVLKLVEEKKSLCSELQTSEKKAFDFKRSLEISRDEISILKANYEKLGKMVVKGVTDAEKNMKQQIRLLAPELDISKVGAHRHVVNGQIVDELLM
ncbi:hypothetical protein PIB30_023773 [Stylosanthes scabra]|uniref:FAR1 domain-containing protein n=1 Tax=Stylosanthes scabra TaxID=79078 RepID=A0ABU6X747_9FABA|nr:hypothetical protein [Stylosanthes scabra]